MKDNTNLDIYRKNMYRIDNFIIGLLLIINVFPPFLAFSFINYVSLGLMVLWYILACVEKKSLLFYVKGSNLVVLLLSAYTILVPCFFGNKIISNRYSSFFIMFSLIIICDFYNERNVEKDKKGIKFLYFIATVIAINTSVNLIGNPYLARTTKSSYIDNSASALMQGIGGYEFAYFLTFSSVLSLFALLYLVLSRKEKYFHLIFFTLSLVTVILANFFTAVVILCVGCMILILLKLIYSKNKIYFIIFLIFMMVLLLFFEPMVNVISNLIIDIMPAGKTVERIEIIRDVALGFSSSLNEQSELITSRFERIFDDIETIKENPLFGIITGNIQINASGYLEGFGQHSFFFDTLTLFGIPVGLSYIWLEIDFYKKESKKSFELSVCMGVMMFIMLLMNNFVLSVAIPGFYLFGYYATLYNEQKGKNGN